MEIEAAKARMYEGAYLFKVKMWWWKSTWDTLRCCSRDVKSSRGLRTLPNSALIKRL